MQVHHPLADEDVPLPSAITANGDDYAIADGVVTAPEPVARDIADAWAARFDAAPDELVREEDGPPDADTCTVVKSDGEMCGRELPCRYHSDDNSEV